MSGLGVEGFKAPVIENEELDAAERAGNAGIAAVAASERQLPEQLWDALIEDGAIVATGLVAERPGEPAFAGAGQANDIMPGVRILRRSFFRSNSVRQCRPRSYH